MLDLDLLHSFVSVVDAGGFTRAGERVHRSQSTVSQQIRKLEETLECTLFVREGRQVHLTEDGERLLGYARRMLALSTEVREAVSGRKRVEVIRLGIPDDFAADTLTAIVAQFARARPSVRLSVRCDLTVALTRGLERGDLDLALLKREPGAGPALATWREHLHWIAGAPAPARQHRTGALGGLSAGLHLPQPRDSRARTRCTPLAHRLRKPQSDGNTGRAGGRTGVALLERRCIAAGHRLVDDALPAVPPSELALCLSEPAREPVRQLAGMIRDFVKRKHNGLQGWACKPWQVAAPLRRRRPG